MTFGRTLAARILLAVLGIVAATMAIGLLLYSRETGALTDRNAVQQARSIAVAVADSADVAKAVTDGDPGKALPGLAERIRAGAGASYVVIIDAHGRRYSHPNPGLIGQLIEEPVVALDGQVHTGVDDGSLGRSANVKAPIFDGSGVPVGEVSVGILESEIGTQFADLMGRVILYTAAVLGIGVVASLVLARTIKRVTFGLEPAEIVALVQEREAMLHGIREGVVGIDARGRVNVVNDEARRLLGSPGVQLGEPVEASLPPGQLRDIITGEVTGEDRVTVTDDHLLVLNRMPVHVGDRMAGWVVTIRDRTEMEGLLRQLDSVSSLTTALRAQEHEFTNRVHVLATLLELGETEEATTYSREIAAHTQLASEQFRTHIAAPVVTALLVSKTTIAAERDVALVLDPASRLESRDLDALPIVTVLGNLIDNAVDAVADDPTNVASHPRGTVTVLVLESADRIHMQVSDTGPGIAAEHVGDVFVDGYTTKRSRDGIHRGIGLALVHRLVNRAGGRIDVSCGEGATFTAVMPMARSTSQAAAGARAPVPVNGSAR